MTDRLLERYSGNVPRYTSYPTAPHFGTSVGPEDYRMWLSELDGKAPLSLYFHIPFCAAMCSFCGCHTKIVRRYEPIADYLATLRAEIDLVCTALPHRSSVGFVHWGGGSPTMIAADDWRRLRDYLGDRFEFAESPEIAVELDPRTASEEYIRALGATGVTRVSVGVQDFDPEVQCAIGRVQTLETTARVIDWLRAAGIEAINIDLMYGLPHQTVECVLETVAKTLSLAPSRIALFGYAHVPWMKRHQSLIDQAALPDAKRRFEQAAAAASALEHAGYRRIGLDHFAQSGDSLVSALGKGRLRRNFQGYTTDVSEALIGFGASAIGALRQGYVQNQVPLHAYAAAIAENTLPIGKGISLSNEDRLRRDVISRLMCDLTVDLEAVRRAHAAASDVFDDDLVRLEPLVEDRIVRVDGQRVTMTALGRPFIRVVAATFDHYLAKNTARHAIAV
ncbi:MAG: oxygen-independent coproporphyrinogen III oxidase [Alphaproteobacteria bacterium]